jgi:hypothetical protein
MGKNKKDLPIPNSGTMLSQKINEDFNKKKPDLSDPNEQKGHPLIAYSGVDGQRLVLPKPKKVAPAKGNDLAGEKKNDHE